MSKVLKLEGFQELSQALNAMGKVGDTIGRKALKEGSEVMLVGLKQHAPKDTGRGAEALRVLDTKKFKKSICTQTGINSKNWNETKHLWFQHWGFENNGLTFKNVPMRIEKHVGWMDKAFEKKKEEVGSKVEDTIRNEIDKILG